jgi:hypothetical protein
VRRAREGSFDVSYTGGQPGLGLEKVAPLSFFGVLWPLS